MLHSYTTLAGSHVIYDDAEELTAEEIQEEAAKAIDDEISERIFLLQHPRWEREGVL